MVSEDIFIVIAPSVFSIIASQRNEICEPPVVKLSQLNQKGYIKNRIKCIDVYMFLWLKNSFIIKINKIFITFLFD